MAGPCPRRLSSVPPGGEHRGPPSRPGQPPWHDALLINLLRSKGTQGATLLWKSTGLRGSHCFGRQLYKHLMTKLETSQGEEGEMGNRCIYGEKKSLLLVCHLYEQNPSQSIPSHSVFSILGPAALFMDLQLEQQDQERA